MNTDDYTACAICAATIPTDEAHTQHGDECPWSSVWDGDHATCTCGTVLEACAECCRDCQRAA